MVNASTNKETNVGYDSVNNIYDMAGNIREWSTENAEFFYDVSLIARGSHYIDSGSEGPAAVRMFESDESNPYMGFSVVLYKQD